MTSGVLNSKPDTAAEALARWDAGENVFTVDMGGLGPGYEQVIHIIAFEFIRELLSRGPIAWPDTDRSYTPEWLAFSQSVEDAVQPKIAPLRCSGGQFGAGRNLAFRVVSIGWATTLDELPSDRLIQVSKDWPKL